MPKNRSWTDRQLIDAVIVSNSVRSVLLKLNLVPAGGNYAQIQRRIKELNVDVSHFTGKGWNKGWKFDPRNPVTPVEVHLQKNSTIQSYKLKMKLIKAGIKEAKCELCGWNQMADDGRIPVELDHVNGDNMDNRLSNLRILCPNCHSLQSTHRGKNKRVKLRLQ